MIRMTNYHTLYVATTGKMATARKAVDLSVAGDMHGVRDFMDHIRGSKD
jgi:hypothetical protein